MEFSVDRFYRINRRVLIWAAFLGLLFILRYFFALIFVTFLLVSFTLPVIDFLHNKTQWSRKLLIVAVYLLILTGLAGLVYYVTPRITAEASSAAGELTSVQQKLLDMKDDVKARYPSAGPMLDQYFEAEQIAGYLDQARQQVGPMLQTSASIVVKVVSTTLLSLLFSFLIVLDLTRLRGEVLRLRNSRLHDVFAETAEPIVRFASVLARSFRAQAMIAVCNAVLTMVGLALIGVPKIVLLTIIVFFFSFIPVLGVFISTTPAVLVAINHAGYGMGLSVIVLVTVIHLIEAYVLNPVIYGQHLHLNPVVVLIILFVGHHFFGVWGMVLGVPVAYYFLFYVFNVQREGDPTPQLETGTSPVEETADSGGEKTPPQPSQAT